MATSVDDFKTFLRVAGFAAPARFFGFALPGRLAVELTALSDDVFMISAVQSGSTEIKYTRGNLCAAANPLRKIGVRKQRKDPRPTIGKGSERVFNLTDDFVICGAGFSTTATAPRGAVKVRPPPSTATALYLTRRINRAFQEESNQ
jgi:hypothetical protein